MLLGGYRYLAELARVLIEDPDWLQTIASESDFNNAAWVCVLMGVCCQFAGDPVRALDSYDLYFRGNPSEYLVLDKLVFQSMALDQLGCLAGAERCARAALARTNANEIIEWKVGDAMTALGSVLLHRGHLEEGAAWLADYRVKVDDSKPLGYLSLYELGWAALRRGDAQTAQVLVNRLVSLATTSKRDVHLSVCAAFLRGAVTGQLGDEDRAGALLSGALVDAREAGLGELEIVALTQLAEWHLRGHRLPEAQGVVILVTSEVLEQDGCEDDELPSKFLIFTCSG